MHGAGGTRVVEIASLRRRAGMYTHLCHHRIGTAANSSQLEFETTLREPNSTTRDGSLPPVQTTSRSKTPLMLRSKRAISRPKETFSPAVPYNDTKVSVHSHELTHLFVPGATQQTLTWNMSLRGSVEGKSQTQGKKRHS